METQCEEVNLFAVESDYVRLLLDGQDLEFLA